MEKVYHPYRMQDKEVEFLFKFIPRAKVFIDLFGGSGVVSRYARSNCNYKEVIYNDKRRFLKKICGVSVFHEDYTTMLGFADKNTIIFADPPFYAYPDDISKWSTKDTIMLIKRLEDVDAKVFMLNTRTVQRFMDEEWKVFTQWKFRQLNDIVLFYKP